MGRPIRISSGLRPLPPQPEISRTLSARRRARCTGEARHLAWEPSTSAPPFSHSQGPAPRSSKPPSFSGHDGERARHRERRTEEPHWRMWWRPWQGGARARARPAHLLHSSMQAGKDAMMSPSWAKKASAAAARKKATSDGAALLPRVPVLPPAPQKSSALVVESDGAHSCSMKCLRVGSLQQTVMLCMHMHSDAKLWHD